MDEQRDHDLLVDGERPTGRHRAEHTPADGSTAGTRPAIGARVPVVHRVGAGSVGAFLLVFGILGFAGGLDIVFTEGQRILGMSSNGLLSAISVATAVVLIAAAVTCRRRADAPGPAPREAR